MPEFAHDVANVQLFLHRMSHESARVLERDVDAWLRAVQPTVQRVLQGALSTGAIPPHMGYLFESLLERWHVHSLAVKLSLLVRLDSLSPCNLLPREVLEQRGAITGAMPAGWSDGGSTALEGVAREELGAAGG
jgi:hypothetical protein